MSVDIRRTVQSTVHAELQSSHLISSRGDDQDNRDHYITLDTLEKYIPRHKSHHESLLLRTLLGAIVKLELGCHPRESFHMRRSY